MSFLTNVPQEADEKCAEDAHCACAVVLSNLSLFILTKYTVVVEPTSYSGYWKREYWSIQAYEPDGGICCFSVLKYGSECSMEADGVLYGTQINQWLMLTIAIMVAG